MEQANYSNYGVENARKGKSLWRQFDFAVVAIIVVLAILLGALNNLRVADERKVKRFGSPVDRGGLETAAEVTQ